MACFDYQAARRGHQPNQNLVDQALKECKAAGVPRRKAISIIALAWIEVGLEFITARSSDSASCACRVPLGLELVADPIGQLVFRQAVGADVDAMAYLQGKGEVKVVGDRVAPAGPLGVVNSQAVADFFEWTVARRKTKLLESFSIGCTQMHLLWGLLGPKATDRCGWPKSWDELWSFYLLSDAGAQINRITYLDADKCGVADWPAEGPGDPHARSIAWLINHCGNAGQAEKYWAGSGTVVSYQQALYLVSQRAAALPY